MTKPDVISSGEVTAKQGGRLQGLSEHRLFFGLLALGLLLRVGVMTYYTPAIFNYYGGDSARLMRLDHVGLHGLFGDDAQPAGYTALLSALRGISSWLPFTVGVQHLLGLVSAALLYGAVLRVGAPRWAALIPAAFVLLSGDQIFLEHGVLTEALWTPVLALAMYLLARSLSEPHSQWWLVAGSLALGSSALVRNVSQVLIPLLAMWAALATPVTLRTRARRACAVLLPAMAILGCYYVISTAGGYSGLVEYRGLQIYGRVAQFADCTRFTPPQGTRQLCTSTPAVYRPGPFYWTFDDGAPLRARLAFDGHNRETLAMLSSFGQRAAAAQPRDYLRVVTADVLRFFDGDAGTARPDSGTGPHQMSFSSTVPTAQGASLDEMAAQFGQRYSGVGGGVADPASRSVLGTYQSIVRVHGLLLVILIVLSVLGVVLGRGVRRAGAGLFLLSGIALLVLPPVVWSYDVRYAVPPAQLLAGSAAIGAAVLVSAASGYVSRKRTSPAHLHRTTT